MYEDMSLTSKCQSGGANLNLQTEANDGELGDQKKQGISVQKLLMDSGFGPIGKRTRENSSRKGERISTVRGAVVYFYPRGSCLDLTKLDIMKWFI